VKSGLLKRNLITVYALVMVLTCMAVGCLRQPGEVISQTSKDSNGALISSSNSSSFNFFQSKKKYSPDESVAKVKVSGTSPILDRIRFDTDSQSHTKVAGNRVASPANSAEQLQKTARKIVDKRAASWRSKSLIAAAKKYPSQRVATDSENSDRVKQASSTVPQGISTGIQRVSNTDSATSQEQETEQISPDSESEQSATDRLRADQIRTDKLSRTLEQATQQNMDSEISQLGKSLHQDLEQAKPASEDLNHEMRRLQINSIMERARREAKRKNYEYAAFLAEQALESSYRGHIAFNPKEESPQMLLQRIKKVMTPQDSEVKPIEHTRPQVQTNGGQRVHNFQFTPSSVHPLKRRPVAKPKAVRSQPHYSTDSSQELPLIVPRNTGTERQTITIPQKRDTVSERRENPRGIKLDTPSFEQQPEEQSEFPVPEKTHPRKTSSVPNPTLKLEMEEIPEEPPAKIRLSGPEPVQQKSVTADEKSSTPGPQLMLPSLPSVTQDLTSQTGRNQKIQTSPVKFRSKIQENRQNDRTPRVEQKLVGANANRPLAKSALTLDEIEWDLDEKRGPQLRGGWWGMSTLLLIIGGAIILLLLAIIVILLRRSNSSS